MPRVTKPVNRDEEYQLWGNLSDEALKAKKEAANSVQVLTGRALERVAEILESPAAAPKDIIAAARLLLPQAQPKPPTTALKGDLNKMSPGGKRENLAQLLADMPEEDWAELSEAVLTRRGARQKELLEQLDEEEMLT